jgi:hypothetical protein
VRRDSRAIKPIIGEYRGPQGSYFPVCPLLIGGSRGPGFKACRREHYSCGRLSWTSSFINYCRAWARDGRPRFTKSALARRLRACSSRWGRFPTLLDDAAAHATRPFD